MIEQLAEWLVNVIHTVGYPGVFAGMFLGNILVPIPVEVVMIPAGYLVQQGKMHFPMIMLFGIAGDICGSLCSYYMAWHFGRKVVLAFGKYFFFTEKTLTKLESFFASHGEVSTLTGRLVPGLRHFMAFPAGLSHMDVRKFVLYTGIGGGIWMAVLATIGYVIGGEKALVKHYLPYITGAVVGGVAVMIAFYTARHRNKKASGDNPDPL